MAWRRPLAGSAKDGHEVGPYEARDEGQWRTEIGWPIFHTGQTDNRATSSSGTS
jgi:hypothetical protein